MAQYYQVQSIGGDEMKPIYTTADIVLHVSSDDVGVSNPNRAQVHSFNYLLTILFKCTYFSYRLHYFIPSKESAKPDSESFKKTTFVC